MSFAPSLLGGIGLVRFRPLSSLCIGGILFAEQLSLQPD